METEKKYHQNRTFGHGKYSPYKFLLNPLSDVAESIQRTLNETNAKKELMEHDYRSQINSLLRKVEQLENTITEERFQRKSENEQKDESFGF